MVLLSTIRHAFHKYPLLVNSISYGSLYVAGDITQQKVRKVDTMNWKGTANIGIITGGIFGPILHYWYLWLDKVLPGNAKKVVFRKMIMDQTLSIPLIIIFYAGIRFLERQPDIFLEAREKTVKTWLTACLYWPPVQAVNFFFMPTRFRTIYVGGAAYIWSIILCLFKATDSKKLKIKPPVTNANE